MQTEAARKVLPRRRSWAGTLGVSLALLFPAGPAFSQTPAPQEQTPVPQEQTPVPQEQTPAPQEQAPTPKEQARVPTSYANVHKGASSGQVLLLLVPRGTVLPIIGRRGEWVQVQLSPALRKTGMVMRWYENEASGWMHDSTVEITKVKEPRT